MTKNYHSTILNNGIQNNTLAILETALQLKEGWSDFLEWSTHIKNRPLFLCVKYRLFGFEIQKKTPI
ncbi:MAG: hypothetical protein V3U92_03480 [Cellulophaga sp.]